MELTDHQLLADWRTQKDAHAFQAIVQRHAAMVFHTALRILKNPAEAEDTSQECFETLITIEKFDHIKSLGAWLHGMATKLSLEHIRSSSRRYQREKKYAEVNIAENDTQEWQEIYPLIDEAIQSLHEKYRTPIIAHFLERQTHATIAQDLNVSRSTITSHINQGIQQIEATLKKKGILTTLALAPALTSQLANAAPIQPSLISSLGKLALTQGHGIATTATSFTIATTLKWVTVAILVSAGTTLDLWKTMSNSPQPLRAATLPIEASTPPLASTPPTSLPPANSQPTQNIILATALQEPLPVASITTAAVVATDSDQPLTNTIHVSGIVTDTGGNPTPNAIVNAVWLSGETEVVTDAQGRFTIPLHRNLFSEGELVFIREVNYQNDVYEVPVRAEVHGDTLVGYLDTPIGQFPISGTRTSQGEGVFGTWDVFITYEKEDHPGQLTLNQDTDGLVFGEWNDEVGPPELSSLVVPETIRLSAISDNKKVFEHDVDVPDNGRDDITLSLITPAIIKGQIMDSDGTPLPNWDITVNNDDDYANARSDENGRFTITDINPGEYYYSAYHDSDARIMESDPITLGDADVYESLTLIHELGQKVTGYVTDNQPLENVSITAIPTIRIKDRNGSLTAYHAKTDANGTYTLSGVPSHPDTRINIEIYHEGYMQLRRPQIRVDGSAIDFSLVKIPTIQGRVLDAVTQAPVTRFRLYAMIGGSNDEKPRLFSATGYDLTDHEDGVFTTPTNGYGNIGIVFSAPGYATTLHRLSSVQPGETRTDVNIALEPVEAINGKVVDSNGDPVRGARVYLGLPPLITSPHSRSPFGSKGVARTNRKGEFKITEYPPTALDKISAHADGYAPAWTDVAPPFGSVEITLREGSHIEGTVTHQGFPVGSAQSSILVSLGEKIIMHAYSDHEGRFAFDMVPNQQINLTASFEHNSQYIGITRELAPQPGIDTQHEIDFTTNGGAFIEGTLLLDDAPPHNALILATTILPNGDKLLYRTETAADGTYTIRPIQSGTYEFGPAWIQLQDASYLEPTEETITIQPNQTNHHDINLITE